MSGLKVVGEDRPNSIEFDATDTLYYGDNDNIYRQNESNGLLSEELLTQVTLTLQGRLEYSLFQTHYQHDKLGCIASKTENSDSHAYQRTQGRVLQCHISFLSCFFAFNHNESKGLLIEGTDRSDFDLARGIMAQSFSNTISAL